MRRPLLLFATLVALVVATPAQALELVQLPGAYTQPVHVSGPPGDASRVLVVEQEGRIRLVKDGVPQATPYLDIAGKVDKDGEEGLLSMAFASPSRFYVYFNEDLPGDDPGSDIVVEAYDVAPGGDTALTGSGDEILRIPHTGGSKGDNHNGGQLQIGPDGNLWISTGDGGGPDGDPDGDAQDPSVLLGKILRIAPGADGGFDPVAGNLQGAVWARGLRNPWRFSFDDATGDLWIGDVGSTTMEEIDRVPSATAAGTNFGWPYYEGTSVFGNGSEPSGATGPLLTHTRDEGWKAIAGGYVLRVPGSPDDGKYVYGDFFVNQLWAYDTATGADGPTGLGISQLSGFGRDGVGRVYATSLGGPVQRVVPTPAPGTGTPPPPGGPTPTDPGGGQPPGGTPIAATARPTLLAGTARRQRAVRRGRLFVRGGCDVDCRLQLTGRLLIGPRSFKLAGSRAGLRAGRRLTLVATLGRRARRAARAALRRGARVRATLVLSATRLDGTPGTTRRTFRVTVTR